jgi:hypothetical protein
VAAASKSSPWRRIRTKRTFGRTESHRATPSARENKTVSTRISDARRGGTCASRPSSRWRGPPDKLVRTLTADPSRRRHASGRSATHSTMPTICSRTTESRRCRHACDGSARQRRGAIVRAPYAFTGVVRAGPLGVALFVVPFGGGRERRRQGHSIRIDILLKGNLVQWPSTRELELLERRGACVGCSP